MSEVYVKIKRKEKSLPRRKIKVLALVVGEKNRFENADVKKAFSKAKDNQPQYGLVIFSLAPKLYECTARGQKNA